MQIPALLDLEQFPDSPYASELRRDFPDLRFSPALERDFQTFHLDRVRSRVRFFQIATCLLSLAVAIHLVVLDREREQVITAIRTFVLDQEPSVPTTRSR